MLPYPPARAKRDRVQTPDRHSIAPEYSEAIAIIASPSAGRAAGGKAARRKSAAIIFKPEQTSSAPHPAEQRMIYPGLSEKTAARLGYDIERQRRHVIAMTRRAGHRHGFRVAVRTLPGVGLQITLTKRTRAVVGEETTR